MTSNLTTTPIHPRYGVEIHGIDLNTVDDDGFAQIRAAFEEHSLLLFRNQDLTDEAHLKLGRYFGSIEDRDADDLAAKDGFEVRAVSNIRDDGSVTGEMDLHTLNLKANMLWHADSTFLPVPALTNILVARVVAPEGGQTQFASTRAGWADMPEELKAQIRGRGIWHRYAQSRAMISPDLAELPMFHKWEDQHWKSLWVNPVNGREALYIASHSYAVDGLEEEEGLALIRKLTEFVTKPEYVVSHTWNVGDVLVWDQRAVLHRATPWDYAQPRKLTSICISASATDGLDTMRP
ncbi:MAG: TauD/TfdA dioxygenase family protein [Paracoccaceae bacterium]